MSQQPIYYRPPSEADSFIIQTSLGCAHNKCRFCSMYKRTRFRILRTDAIIAGMEADAAGLGHLAAKVTSLFLGDGSAIVMRAEQLLRVMEHAHRCFPNLERIACYGAAQHIIRKTPEELRALRGLGLRRIHCGIETGNDDILRRVNKGCTRADLLRTGELLFDAGIELDGSIMIGIGGYALSDDNARDTGSLLNACAPATVRIRTFVPKLGTPMGDEYLNGEFGLLDPYAALFELRALVGSLVCATELRSDHWTNFAPVYGFLPKDKRLALAVIDEVLARPLESFRPVGAAHPDGD